MPFCLPFHYRALSSQCNVESLTVCACGYARPVVPSLHTVLRLRYYARILVRVLAVLWICLAIYRGTEQALNLLNQQLGALTSGLGLDSSSLTLAVVLSIVLEASFGLCLLWFEKPLVRWLLPLPRLVCPGCDYRIASLTHGKCPECGLRFGPDEPAAAAGTAAANPAPRRPAPPAT